MIIQCPYCNEECTINSVDNGIGEQQIESASCDKCKAREIPGDDWLDISVTLTGEEIKIGWYKGVKK